MDGSIGKYYFHCICRIDDFFHSVRVAYNLASVTIKLDQFVWVFKSNEAIAKNSLGDLFLFIIFYNFLLIWINLNHVAVCEEGDAIAIREESLLFDSWINLLYDSTFESSFFDSARKSDLFCYNPVVGVAIHIVFLIKCDIVLVFEFPCFIISCWIILMNLLSSISVQHWHIWILSPKNGYIVITWKHKRVVVWLKELWTSSRFCIWRQKGFLIKLNVSCRQSLFR